MYYQSNHPSPSKKSTSNVQQDSDPAAQIAVARIDALFDRVDEIQAERRYWATREDSSPRDAQIVQTYLKSFDAELLRLETEKQKMRGDFLGIAESESDLDWDTIDGRQTAAIAPLKPVLRRDQQDQVILSQLEKMGFDPQSLPPNPLGYPGVKSKVRDALGKHKLFAGKTTFNKAWARLREGEQLDYVF